MLLYNKTDPETVTKELSVLGGTNHVAFKCDLTSHKEVEEVFARIKIDIGNVREKYFK